MTPRRPTSASGDCCCASPSSSGWLPRPAGTRTTTSPKRATPRRRRAGATPAARATARRWTSPACPGVTDDEIRFAAFGTNSNNPLGTCVLDCYVHGINAYFAYRNSEGGHLRPGAGPDRRPRRRALEEPAAGARDHLRRRHLRRLQRHPGRQRLGRRSPRPGMPLYAWNIHPAESTGRGRVRQHGRALHRLHRAGRRLRRQAGRGQQGRHPRLRRQRELQAVRRAPPADRSSCYADEIGGAEVGVLQRRPRLRHAERHRPRGHGDEGRRRRLHRRLAST